MKELSSEKKSLRKHMQKLRSSLSFTEVQNKSIKIKEILYSLPAFQKADKIMIYVSFNNEVDTINIIQNLLMEEKEVIVPICNTSTYTLIPSKILSIDELSVSHFGILEPQKPFVRPANPEDIDVILIPGLAFDKNRNRLGYGKGYYDRFLKRIQSDSLKIALAFNFQIIDTIPIGTWDIPMDMIITEENII